MKVVLTNHVIVTQRASSEHEKAGREKLWLLEAIAASHLDLVGV